MNLLRALVRYVIPSIALVGCNVSKPTPAASPQPAPRVPTPPALVAAPAPPPPKADSSVLSVATFKKDELISCVTISAEVPATSQRFGASNLTALLADEYFIASVGGDTVLKENRDAFAEILKNLTSSKLDENFERKMKENYARAMKSINKKDKEAKGWLDAMPRSWPTPNFAKKAKSGEMPKVDSCAIPNHVPLGTCEVREDGPPAPWKITNYVFSVEKVVDSDAAMKSCLSLNGKWSAADATDPNIAAERMRQHALKLQKIARELEQ